jgi:hypothetical protein
MKEGFAVASELGFLLQILISQWRPPLSCYALRSTIEPRLSELRLTETRWKDIAAKKAVKKIFKLKYQIFFFVEICSVVLYL